MALQRELVQPVGGVMASAATGARRRFFRRKVVPWLFILPLLALHFVVVIVPSLQALYYALTDWSGIGQAEFIGFANFRNIMQDHTYRSALVNNLQWMLFFLTVPFAMALIAAQILAPVQRGSMFIRTALFIPYVLPSVINANIWMNLLSPRMGVGAQLDKAGIPGLDIAFLGRPDTALITIAFVDNWHFWGFLMVLFLTAMQGISQDLYDAAKIDGANRVKEFLHVTIPGILPTLAFMMMLVAIWSFLVFDYVWILTQGGPANASEVLGSYLYKQVFNRFEAGYASAIGLTMSLFAGFIIGLFALLRKRGWEI